MAGEEERLIAGQSRGFTGKARDQSAAHGSRAGWMSLPLVPIEISLVGSDPSRSVSVRLGSPRVARY